MFPNCRLLDDLEERDLKSFTKPSNPLTRNLYVDLPLPWTLAPPVTDFDEAAFFCKEWGPERGVDLGMGAWCCFRDLGVNKSNT